MTKMNPIVLWMFSVLSIVMAPLCASTQTTLPITLETILEIGGAQNLTIKSLQKQEEILLARMAKEKEWWLPALYGGVQTHHLNGAVMNSNGNYFLDVERNNLWAGLGLEAEINFSKGIYTTKAASHFAEAAVFKTEAERNQILLEVVHAYYDFLSAQMEVNCYQTMSADAANLAAQLQVRTDAGMGYESDWLLAKSRVNHMEINSLKAKAKFAERMSELTQLLHLSPETSLISVDSVLIPFQSIQPTDEVQHEIALQQRSEVKAMELERLGYEAQQNQASKGFLIPQLNVNAYTSYDGVVNGTVTPMVPELYPDPQQLYPTGAFNVALMWKIPLARFTYKGDLKQQKARSEFQQIRMQQQEAEIQSQLSVAKAQLKFAAQRVDIAIEAREYAREALSQAKLRQEMGTLRPLEILQTQEIYLSTELDYVEAVADHNKAFFAIKVALGEKL